MKVLKKSLKINHLTTSRKKLKYSRCLFALHTIFCIMLPHSTFAEQLKISTSTPPPHIFTKSAHFFANKLTTYDPEVFNTKVYPLSKLGDIPTVLSMLQSGAIAFAVVPVGDLARWDIAFSAWYLPYLFEDISKAESATNGVAAKKILQLLEKRQLKAIAYLFPGQRHLLSKFPVNNLSDIKNRKIRAFPNSIFKRWWEELEAAPVAMALPQIAPALMTGVLDGIDADLDIIRGLKFYQQAPYLTLTNHMSFPGVLLVSQTWWQSLETDQKNAINKIAKDTQKWALVEQTKIEVKNLQFLLDAGVEITKLDRSELVIPANQVRNEFINKDLLIKAFFDEASNTAN